MPTTRDNNVIELVELLSRRLILTLFPDDSDCFDEVWERTLHAKTIDDKTSYLLERRRPSAPDFTLPRSYTEPDVHIASWNILTLMFQFHRKLQQIDKNIGYSSIRRLLEDCVVELEIPEWLRPRTLELLPPLLYSGSPASIAEETNPNLGIKPYVVYTGSQLPQDCDAADLLYYRNLASSYAFDCFFDDISPKKRVLVGQRDDLFNPGEGYPFRTLKYLLSRVGQDVTYRDLRLYLWSPVQFMRLRAPSRTIRDTIVHIRQQVTKAKLHSESDPSMWFQKTTIRGVIKVSSDLKSCLITTPSALVRRTPI